MYGAGIPVKKQYQPMPVIMGVVEDARRAAVFAGILDFAPQYGYGAVDPLLVLAQSALETGWFTSRLIREDKNAFGMMHPNTRPNVSDGPGPSGFACYLSLADSAQDYFMRQRYYRVENTSDAAAYIASTLNSGYATASHYATTWADMYATLLGGDGSGDGSTDPGNIPPLPNPDGGGLLWMGAGLLALAFLTRPASGARA